MIISFSLSIIQDFECNVTMIPPRDPLADYEDVVPLPIFGPSLTINGYSAQWKDLSGEKETDNGLEIRLQFQAEAASKSSSSIDITNDGTAAIYFSWKVC